ncbi:MAG: hypothetical protein R3E76_04100 [Planctomycetota bacterium]
MSDPNHAVAALRAYGETELVDGIEAFIRHPLADQTELLQSLGVSMNDCQSVDLYFVYGNDLHFMSISAGHSNTSINHFQKPDAAYPSSFYCRIASKLISRDALIAGLRLAKEILDRPSVPYSVDFDGDE